MGTPAGAQPTRGSLRTSDGFLFRVTSRCLVEDLGLAPRAQFARVLEGQVGTALRSTPHRVRDAGAPQLSRAVGVIGEGDECLIVHPAAGGRLLWVVASGRDDAQLRRLDEADLLWPTEDDIAWLEDDMLALRLRRLQIDAAVAASEAKRPPDQPVEIAAPPPASALRLAVDAAGTQTSVGILLADGADPDPEAHSRTIALMLTAIH